MSTKKTTSGVFQFFPEYIGARKYRSRNKFAESKKGREIRWSKIGREKNDFGVSCFWFWGKNLFWNIFNLSWALFEYNVLEKTL